MARRNGFTVIEILLVMAICVTIIATVAVGVGALCGNFWYTDDTVLRELQAEHQEVISIQKTERKVFDFSVITVKERTLSGTNRWCLNTNILWNYTFSKCE